MKENKIINNNNNITIVNKFADDKTLNIEEEADGIETD